MGVIISFVESMIPYMLLAMPLYIIARAVFLKARKVLLKWPREIVMLLFTVFLVGLASQTIVPGIVSNGLHSVNLIPFRFVLEIYSEVFLNDNISYLLINILGNIVLFIPIGLTIPLLWKTSGWRTIAIGFLFSLFIEMSQLFLLRGTDVDDLILNTFGVLLGVFIYRTLQKYCAKVIARFRL